MATGSIKSNRLEELQFVDDTYNYVRVTRVGNVYDVEFFRKQAVPNGTDAFTIDSRYAPGNDMATLDYYPQTSGYAVVLGVLKTTGVITLSSTQYNEPLAGSFHWTYSK